MFKFRGFLDPSNQIELYHTSLLSKIYRRGTLFMMKVVTPSELGPPGFQLLLLCSS